MAERAPCKYFMAFLSFGVRFLASLPILPASFIYGYFETFCSVAPEIGPRQSSL